MCCVGAGDTPCAALGSGLSGGGDALLTTGTGGQIVVHVGMRLARSGGCIAIGRRVIAGIGWPRCRTSAWRWNALAAGCRMNGPIACPDAFGDCVSLSPEGNALANNVAPGNASRSCRTSAGERLHG